MCKVHHGKVRDFTQSYLPLIDATLDLEERAIGEPRTAAAAGWWRKQYSFREQYETGLTPAELEGLWWKLQRDPRLIEAYLRNMFSQTVGTEDYFDYICDMRYLEEDRNSLCSKHGRLLPPKTPLTSATSGNEVIKLTAQEKADIEYEKKYAKAYEENYVKGAPAALATASVLPGRRVEVDARLYSGLWVAVATLACATGGLSLVTLRASLSRPDARDYEPCP